MKKQPRFFCDYIYYRLTQIYWKWEGRNSITSTIVITLAQICMITDIFLLVMYFFVSHESYRQHLLLIKIIVVVIFLITLLYNFKKYKNKYSEYNLHWKSEARNLRFLKGSLVLLILGLPLVLLFTIGALT